MNTVAQFLLFFAVCWGVLAAVGDYKTTVLALAGGMKEGNPAARFFFSKIGQPATAFMAISCFIISAVLLSTQTLVGSLVWASAIACLETYMYLRNKKNLKKYNISTK